MLDQTASSSEILNKDKPETESQAQVWDKKAILWSLPQPILVLGSMLLVATMVHYKWMNYKDWSLIMMMIPVPVLIVAERLWAKR